MAVKFDPYLGAFRESDVTNVTALQGYTRTLFFKQSQTELRNTTLKTSLKGAIQGNAVLQPADMTVKDAYRFTGSGYYGTSNSASQPTLYLEIVLGSTVVGSIALDSTTINQANKQRFWFTCDVYFNSIGAGGQFVSETVLFWQHGSTSLTMRTPYGTSETGSIDTTTSKNIDVFFQMNTFADTLNFVRLTHFTAQEISIQ